MPLLGVILLSDAGLPIYRKLIGIKDKPVEPLIAAIIGLANELGAGDISHVEFEEFSMIFTRGLINRRLILVMITDKVNHVYYSQAIYLMRKLEKRISRMDDIIDEEIIKEARETIESIFPTLDKIPDILSESFEAAISALGPLMHTSLMLILYRKFNEDPFIVFIKDPKRFYDTIRNFLGEATDLLVKRIAEYMIRNYNMGIPIDDLINRLNAVLRLDEMQRREKFGELIEFVIDKVLSSTTK